MKKILLLSAALLGTATMNAQINLTSGLLAHYTFDGNANDASGNGHNGVINGTPLLTSDRFGNPDGGYYFDGTGNWIDVTDLNQQFNSITVTVWAQSVNSGTIGTIISKHANAADATLLLRQENGSHVAGTNINGNFMNLNGAPISGAYDFLVFHYDGTNVSLYINNVLSVSMPATGAVAQNTSPWAFGRYAAGGSIQEYYTGTIDDVRIYDRALNTQEIDALYNEANPTASLNEMNEGAVEIYPNPAQNTIALSVDTPTSITITDVLGNTLETRFVAQAETIDISDYKAGIYFVSSPNGTSTKFIKL
jgi:hypothetical protein